MLNINFARLQLEREEIDNIDASVKSTRYPEFQAAIKDFKRKFTLLAYASILQGKGGAATRKKDK